MIVHDMVMLTQRRLMSLSASAAALMWRRSWDTPVHQSSRRCLGTLVPRSRAIVAPYLVDSSAPDVRPPLVNRLTADARAAKRNDAEAALRACMHCPRHCNVDRTKRLGVCGVGDLALVDTVAPHFGEEACLQGDHGSGTLFFTGCNLKCVFCQNHDISHTTQRGFRMTPTDLADWMLRLQNEGSCHNINFVTPEHVVPQVAMAILEAADRGLRIPVIYNTSAYDSEQSLALLDGLVDIYLPDFKMWRPESAAKWLKARDYPDVARSSLETMQKQVGTLVHDGATGLAVRGVLVRHLIMPGMVAEAMAILHWIATNLGRDTYIHLMEQYKPDAQVGKMDVSRQTGKTRIRHAQLNRPCTQEEISLVRQAAEAAGLWRFEEIHV